MKRFRDNVEETIPPAKKQATVSPPHKPCLKMVVAGIYYPKPNPTKPQGEDAHFICLHQQTVGVADGVGGWVRRGIDAGKYARELMQNAECSVLHQPHGSVNPRTVLDEAFRNTKAKGSSTACIATLKHNDNNHFLLAVNVGDSGFMLFRNKQLVFQSPTQQHKFNKPYQLGNSRKSDKPEKAMEFEVGVMAGDIVVFGTDGVFDNVYPEEIERCIDLTTSDDGKRVEPEELAWVIAEVALCNSRNRFARTPYSEASGKANMEHVGGKIDDITVLVARIASCN